MFCWTIFSVLSIVAVNCNRVPVPCHEMKTNENNCQYCLVESHNNAPSDYDDIVGHVKFGESHMTGYWHENYNWSYDKTLPQHYDITNMTITLYSWNKEHSENFIGFPIPGCCGIALTQSQCTAQQCIMGDVYFSMEIRQVSVISNNSIDHIGKCSNERKTVEFLHLCPKKVEVWMQENRCSCFLYDTKTGVITPSNTTASGDGNSAAVWFSTDKKSINGGKSGSNACTFKIHRDFVTNQGTMVSNSEGAESTLFQRGVYRMPTLFWQNGIVSEKSAISTENFSINCQVETFENGDSLFELSTTSSDNDTFICFILWPNGTHEFAPIGAHVKCMPQNTTFNVKSHIYVPNKQTPIEIMQVIISISVIGIVILLALAAVLFMRCKRRVEKILKDNKKVPEILNEIMKNEHPIQENKMDMEIEKYDKYDALAKSKLSEAHQEIANQNYNSDDFAESRVIARESGKFNSGESLKSNDSGVVSDLYVEKRAKFSALALSTSIDEDGGELPLGESPSPKIRSYSRTGVYSKRSLFSKVSSTSIESRDTGCGSDSDLDSFDAEDSLRTPYFDKRHFAEKNLEIET